MLYAWGVSCSKWKWLTLGHQAQCGCTLWTEWSKTTLVYLSIIVHNKYDFNC